jgi:hypothetical protein
MQETNSGTDRGTTLRVALTLKSANKKTGNIPQSYSGSESCPPICPFLEICYPSSGPAAIHWRKIDSGERGVPWAQFLLAVGEIPAGQLWRHNIAGDLPGEPDLQTIDALAVADLAAASSHARGFTYTHYDVINHAGNRATIRAANAAGFTINASANNLEHADAIKRAAPDLPVAVVLPSDFEGQTCRTPDGHLVTVCPAVTRKGVTCKSCKLCAVENRAAIVGFPAHGTHKKVVTEIAKS